MSNDKLYVPAEAKPVKSDFRSKGPHEPVDRLTGKAISIVICVTGAVDYQSSLVTVCVVVTTSVVDGTQVRSYIELEKKKHDFYSLFE